MLPPSHAGADRPQVLPGRIWFANTCSILFLVAFSIVLFTAPDRLRESLCVSPEPSLVSLAELAGDQSRDARNAVLRGVRVESVEQREARENTIDKIYQFHVAAPDDDPQRGELRLFVCADDVLLPGSDEGAVDAKTAATKDLRDVDEFSGVLRRPNPLAYRMGVLDESMGIPENAWLLHLDKPPFQLAHTMLIVAASLLLGALGLLGLLSQNWIPNRGLNFQPIAALFCLIGWPLRRYRNRWPVRSAFLIAGISVIAGGFYCVASGDRGLVIDALYLEYWLAGITAVMLGLAMVMRVAWVVCRPAASTAQNAGETQAEPDDERPAQERPFTRLVVSVRTVSGGVVAALFLAEIANGLAGNPVGALSTQPVALAMFGSCVVFGCSHWLLLAITRGFHEKSYEPLERTPRAVRAYRKRSDDMLEKAGFQRCGAYRIRGSAFYTNIEVQLGCNSMVIAEFISLSGNRGIELTSITDSGTCIVTASCAASEGKQATRWTGRFYSHCAGTADFEQLLRTHLGAAADLAEQHDTAITILTGDDVLDVLRYSSRAHHDMLFQQGESKDRVGPASYGRFRFPTGLAETHQQDAVELDLAEAAEESVVAMSAGD